MPVAPTPPPSNLDEIRMLRVARRRLRLRSFLMALAIFFSLAPLSFFSGKGVTWWMVRDEPVGAAVYGAIGGLCWAAYAAVRYRSRSL